MERTLIPIGVASISLICEIPSARISRIGKERFCTVFTLCPYVIADHRNTAGSQTDSDRNCNLEEFHNNAEHSQRNLRIFRLPENGI